MNIYTSDTNINNMGAVSPLRQVERSEIPDEVYERISQIKKGSAASLEISDEGKEMAANRVIETTSIPHKVFTDLVRTGYEAIDNKIVDALKNVEEDVRQYAYDIVRYDFLRYSKGDMSEDERQDLIALGLKEAEYISENYLSGTDAEEFMNAMKKVAGIAAGGVEGKNGVMDYGLPQNREMVDKNGHTIHTTDTVGMMKEYSPETYKKYSSLLNEFGQTGDKDKLIASMKLMIQFVVDTAKSDPGAVDRYEKGIAKKVSNISDKDVRHTFDDVDTASSKRFINSLKNMQHNNLGGHGVSYTNRIKQIFSRMQLLTK